MAVAHEFSKRSTCTRTSVGAVATLNGRVVSSGWNGTASGMAHCSHSVHTRCRDAIHSEQNVIYSAARAGISLLGSVVYTTLSPCYMCALGLIQSGVTRVVYRDLYRDPSGIDLLRQSGVTVEELDVGELSSNIPAPLPPELAPPPPNPLYTVYGPREWLPAEGAWWVQNH